MKIMHLMLNCLGSFGLSLISVAAFALPVTLTVDPLAPEAYVGDSVVFSVSIAGLEGDPVDPNAPSLGTYDIDFSFDPVVFRFQGIAFGNQLDIFGLGSIQTTTSTAGTFSVFELSLDSIGDLVDLQAPSFSLFSIELMAIAVGSSEISISRWLLSDELGVELVPSTVTNATAKVLPAQVSEPGSWAMILLGLVGLGLRRIGFQNTREPAGDCTALALLKEFPWLPCRFLTIAEAHGKSG